MLFPNDLFGLSEIFSEPTGLVETRDTVSVTSIDHASVLSLAARDINVAMWLLNYINEHSSSSDRWSMILARGNALEKVAMLLLDLYKRLMGAAPAGQQPIRVPITQQDIADFTGLASPYISRTLALLRARGSINVFYGAIEIVDPKVLMVSAPVMADFWVGDFAETT